MKSVKGRLDQKLRFERGLIPVVTQSRDGKVLMMAYMNRRALALSLSTGLMHYWSRSRRKIWMKGEVSGHIQRVLGARVNCEMSSMLFTVDQMGGCCHKGYGTCFYRAVSGRGLKVIEGRAFEPSVVYRCRRQSATHTEKKFTNRYLLHPKSPLGKVL